MIKNEKGITSLVILMIISILGGIGYLSGIQKDNRVERNNNRKLGVAKYYDQERVKILRDNGLESVDCKFIKSSLQAERLGSEDSIRTEIDGALDSFECVQNQVLFSNELSDLQQSVLLKYFAELQIEKMNEDLDKQ